MVAHRARPWHLIVVLVLITVIASDVGGAALLRHNQRAWAGATRALEEQGYVCTPEVDAQARATIDPARQSELDAALAAMPPLPEHAERDPDGTATALRAGATRVLSAIADGGARIGDKAIAADEATMMAAASASIPHYLSARATAAFLHAAIAARDDVLTRLRQFDALVAAVGEPASIMDAMMAASMADGRDSAWLDALRSASVDAREAEAWLAQASGERVLLAAAWRAERVRQHSIAFGLSNRPLTFADLANPVGGWGRAILVSGYALAEVDLARREAEALGRPAPTAPVGIGGNRSPIWRIAMPNLAEVGRTFSDLGCRAAQRRLAGRIILASRAHGALPADGPEAVSWLQPDAFAAGDERAAMRYERTASDAFRIIADGTAPPKALPAPRRLEPVAVVGVTLR